MHAISTTDLMPPDWNFLADQPDGTGLRFTSFTTQTATGLARIVPHPMAARLQTARRACRLSHGQPDAVLFSHLPMMAAVTNLVRKISAPSVPQIAFSFNYTTLPAGGRRRALARGFRGIEEFVVYSTFERGLYADAFGIAPERLFYLPWAMNRPEPGPVNPMAGKGPYICAIGGEARDYAGFAKAMRATPGLRAAVVARSYSLAGVDLPANVTAFTDLPTPQTWALLAGSEAMVLPLRDGETACGHITLVAARQLGIPVIATDSRGLADYVAGGRVAALVPPQDPEAISAALATVVGNSTLRAEARAGTQRAEAEHAPSLWIDYLRSKAAHLRG